MSGVKAIQARVQDRDKDRDRALLLAAVLRRLAAVVEGPQETTPLDEAEAALFYGVEDFLSGRINVIDLHREIDVFAGRIVAVQRECPDCAGIGMPPQKSCRCQGAGWIWAWETLTLDSPVGASTNSGQDHGHGPGQYFREVPED